MDNLSLEMCFAFCVENPMEVSTLKMNWDCLTNEMQKAIWSYDMM